MKLKEGLKSSKLIYSLIILIVLIIAAVSVYAATDKTQGWHTGEQFSIQVSGLEKTLQLAISQGVLKEPSTRTYSNTYYVPTPVGHSADSIYVSVNGVQSTLLTALATTNGLCSSGTASYTPIDLGHYANQIEVVVAEVTMSFQDAIDAGTFCCAANYGDSCPVGAEAQCVVGGALSTFACDGSCSVETVDDGTPCTPAGGGLGQCNSGVCVATTCVPETTRECNTFNTDCVSYTGTQTCLSTGAWPSGTTGCTMTYASRGTTCGGVDYKACDGNGVCEGYSTSGCASCPLGSYSENYQKRCYRESSSSPEEPYSGRYRSYTDRGTFSPGWENPLLTTYTTWDYNNLAPICESYVCLQENFWGACQTWAWNNNPWQMKPSAVSIAETCSDGTCNNGETCETCPADCGECEGDVCPDGYCTGSETPTNCPEDCGISCTDTCSSLGYDCGTQKICGQIEDCNSCDTGYYCLTISGEGSTCVPDEGCIDNDDCYSGQTCIDYECVECVTHDDCGSQFCDNGICVECITDSNCNGYCYQGYCVECTSGSQCASGNCVGYACAPAEEPCENTCGGISESTCSELEGTCEDTDDDGCTDACKDSSGGDIGSCTPTCPSADEVPCGSIETTDSCGGETCYVVGTSENNCDFWEVCCDPFPIGGGLQCIGPNFC